MKRTLLLLALSFGGLAWTPPARGQSTPTDTSAMREEAATAYRMGDVELAIRLCRELISREPNNPQVYRDLMRLLNATERYAECAQVARSLLELGEDDRDTFLMLARALHRDGQWRDALDAYDAILVRWPDQPDIRLSRAQALEALRDWPAAAAELAALRRDHPGFTTAVVTEARVLSALGRHAEAATAWAEAARTFPDNPSYRMAAAEAQFHAHAVESALATLHALLNEFPEHARARNFLVQYALANGNVAQAISLLEAAPPAQDPVAFGLYLAGLHLRLPQPDQALTVLNTVLQHDPHCGEALLAKANILRDRSDFTAAADCFAQAAAINPHYLWAWQGLADAHLANNNPTNALRALQQARALDPTDPYLLLREARCRHAAGDSATAQNLLTDWLAANPDPPLPALLYHGLTARPDDPLLASRVHMTTTVFAEHMRALHDAGYTTLTTATIRDWLHHRTELPPRAVWIAFDDGRQDSLREATPILARYKMRATMFVAGVNADRNLPGYASWAELGHWQTQTVWELQSHGDQASIQIPIDAAGRQGLFLPNRQWLPDTGQLESTDAWQARVANDYTASIAKFRDHLGLAPIAFAWPEGNFGQRGNPTAVSAAAFNLHQAREHFALAFHQDAAGLNVRTRDPILLTRKEPSPQATGEEILRHFAERNPIFLVQRELLQLAIARRDAPAARQWLDALRDSPLTPVERQQARMRVAYLAGDYAEACAAADAALTELDRTGLDEPDARLDALNTRARSLEQLGRRREALSGFQASLRLNPDQIDIWMAAAHTAESLRRYRLAAAILDRAQRLNPDDVRLAPARGRVATANHDFAVAADAWTAAAKANPEDPNYPFFAAEAHFNAGKTTVALAQLQDLLAQHPDHALARDFLIRHALVTSNIQAAIDLLAGSPTTPQSPPALVRLAGLHLRLDQWDDALRCLNTALRLDPAYGEALMLKADVLRRKQSLGEAALVFEELLAANRWCLDAWVGLADTCMADGRPAASVAALRAARALNPTDPNLLLREAQSHYRLGRQLESREMLERWLADNPDPALPVLLYHGLTPRADDPLLASSVHMTTATFESQMRALRSAGYHAVTAADIQAWFNHERDLPPKAVWIVFDDGRLDSFREATPILDRLGLKAAMFVDPSNAGRNLPGYATWDELARIQTNGIWELHSHGYLAASNLTLNAQGREGLFLPNRRWLPTSGTLESPAHWRQRVAADYVAAADIMTARLGVRPTAYAWPEGHFGQRGIPTAGGAAAYNLEQVRQQFALAFHQDTYGFNPRTRDRALLTRREPDPNWSGKDLLRHLSDESPAARITLQLLKQATWEGRLHEAHRWLAHLESLNTSRAQQRLAAAIVYSAAGDQGSARVLAQDALEQYPLKEAAAVLDTIERRDRPQLALTARYWADDDDRSTWEASATHQTATHGAYAWSAGLRVAEHREDGFDTVREAAPTMNVTHGRGLHHRLGAEGTVHGFDGGPDTMLGGAATWRAEWTDTAATHLTLSRDPVYTVQAMNDDIAANAASAAGIWRPHPAWQYTLRGGYTSYSDDNARRAAAIELLRRVDGITGLALLAQASLDDADQDEAAYYTPRNFRLARLGAQYEVPLGPGRRLRLRYLPGYGEEDDADSRMLHAGNADMTWPLKPGLVLRPSVNYQRTPTYSSGGGAITLQHDF